MAYDMKTDYAALIGKTTDPAKKAEYESARNEKIAAMNAAGANPNNYTPTYDYTKPAASAQAAGGQTPAGGGTKVSYIDADGNKKTGYIFNGSTYTDATGKTPVGIGSIVTTGDGNRYIKTDQGSMLYSDYLKRQNSVGGTPLDTLTAQMGQVQDALARALAGNDTIYAAQLRKLQSDLQARIDSLNRSYKDTNRQLYVDYMNSKKQLPQQLAAMGHTGGLRESSLLGLDTSYQGNLNSNEQARIAGISELENGAAGDEMSLLIAKAQADREQQENAYSRQLALAQQIASQQNADRERELENAQMIGKLTGDYSQLYSLLGVTQEATPKYKKPSDDGDSGLIVDEASVAALGLGELTAEELANLVKRGFVTQYIDGNKIKFRRTVRENPNKNAERYVAMT